FLDTNLLLYAYDAGSPAKHAVAVRILEDLWKSGTGVLSTQILQEFFVDVTKKIPKPLSVTVGREIVEDFLTWKIVPVEGRTILRAIDLHEKHKYAFWDSLVIQSAIEGGARWLLSRRGRRVQVFPPGAVLNQTAFVKDQAALSLWFRGISGNCKLN
ncbi:MAG: PilT protein domain protein, partial [Deltaproteobacteria bacterium]|nr:PilT protein domain protein [Deltaproteobacteria bacterium]